MQKIAGLIGAALLVSVFPGEARATWGTICQSPEQMRAQTPEEARRNVRGFVRSVVGDVITVELPNGKLNTVTVPRRERAALGQIVGSEVIVTPNYCYRILFAPPPIPKPGMRVGGTLPIQFQGVTLQRQVTPLPPRTVTPPPPIPIAPAAPIIIPQTW